MIIKWLKCKKNECGKVGTIFKPVQANNERRRIIKIINMPDNIEETVSTGKIKILLR